MTFILLEPLLTETYLLKKIQNFSQESPMFRRGTILLHLDTNLFIKQTMCKYKTSNERKIDWCDTHTAAEEGFTLRYGKIMKYYDTISYQNKKKGDQTVLGPRHTLHVARYLGQTVLGKLQDKANYQAWHFTEPMLLKCSSRNLQFPYRIPFTEEKKMRWCPCPFENEAYGPETFTLFVNIFIWNVLGV